MASRYDRIVIEWTADFLPPGRKVIELTPDEQEDPRLLAVLAWWDEKMKAAMAAAPRDGNPFTTG